jgi:hypothetical protein
MPTISRKATPSPRTAGPRPVAAERRQRGRLRELCDEVIASHRMARDGDLFSERDRQEARAFLPALGGRTQG